MKKKIEMDIVCPSCNGTGVYSGMGESKNTAVICYQCQGTGKYHYVYEYEEFTERKISAGIDRVYLKGYGYKIGTGKINFSKVGEIDMDKEGVSYEEFLSGKMPQHIKKLACPMLADQGACHKIKGFTDVCDKLNGGYLNHIPSCKHTTKSTECWDRFDKKSTTMTAYDGGVAA
jgi:hypothetical protein